MQRVERHIAIGNKRLDELCFLSKNLYNYVNYLIRQEFTQNKKFLSEYEVTTMLAKDKQADYIALPSQTSQQIIKILFKDWKQNCNMGKVNNQNFVSIPFEKLISMIQYKCEEVGIKVIVTEESYTSKTDHYSDEAMCHHENYMGKRIKRGLFRSASGKMINADLNGAIGILRKVVGERLWQIADRGVVGTPSRIQFV